MGPKINPWERNISVMGKKISNGILLFRVFKNCITGKYEEILVNTFHFVKYRVILQQNQYFVCFAIFKTSSNCGLTSSQ
jgi:hypothetical protein